MFAHTEALKFTVRLSQLGVNYLNSMSSDGHLFTHTSFKHLMVDNQTEENSNILRNRITNQQPRWGTMTSNVENSICQCANANECWIIKPKNTPEMNIRYV